VSIPRLLRVLKQRRPGDDALPRFTARLTAVRIPGIAARDSD
jgi:hypothetical protein